MNLDLKWSLWSRDAETFPAEGQSFEFGLDDVLDAFGNDLYWDDRGNWADADKLTVTTI